MARSRLGPPASSPSAQDGIQRRHQRVRAHGEMRHGRKKATHRPETRRPRRTARRPGRTCRCRPARLRAMTGAGRSRDQRRFCTSSGPRPRSSSSMSSIPRAGGTERVDRRCRSLPQPGATPGKRRRTRRHRQPLGNVGLGIGRPLRGTRSYPARRRDAGRNEPRRTPRPPDRARARQA